MTSLQTERIDVSTQRFGDTQAVQREQRHQRMFPCRRQAGGDEERADLVAIQASRIRLIVEAGTAHMDGRRVLNQALLLGVAVEAGDRTEPAGDGRSSPAAGLQLAPEAFDIHAVHVEEPALMLAHQKRTVEV